MTGASRALGQVGEDLAAAWYRGRGYEIVARNRRCPHGELDVVCVRRRVLVICEVKTRSSTRLGTPAEAVTPSRQRRLRRAAACLLASGELSVKPSAVRFDVAEVLDGQVNVIEGAF